jgi:hypothetical protein
VAKPGRKPKHRPRTKSGSPQRSPLREAKERKSVVVAARMRHYSLPEAKAEEHLAGYVIGRMALAGLFGRDYSAALTAVTEYVEATAAYMRYKSPMMPMPKAMDYLAGKGASTAEEPSAKRIAGIVRRYEQIHSKLLDMDAQDRMIFHHAAFHDIEPQEHWRPAIVRCVEKLSAA